ncbi:hypothetical protein N6L24_15405 [Cognatishimia sp. SS12]|uniref:hypothetical protein n=1 Tax=Cognatishimia sp. SS12 TaxID=2979465 RepID=UPI00232CB989|nr:hypothetical protein [Cognatishimia sp. SS12]MDC0739675.1 hypothetical protein [Cognatishimia sp. SS12]
MSNPVKNTEIEDVLSSIRRLVSENGAGQRGRSATETAAAEKHAAEVTRNARSTQEQAEDRLVLTEALRVPEAPSDPTGDVAEAARAPEVTLPDNPFGREMREDLDKIRSDLPSFLQRRAAQPEPVQPEPVQSEPAETTAAESVEEGGTAESLGQLRFESARDDAAIVLKDPDAEAAQMPETAEELPSAYVAAQSAVDTEEAPEINEDARPWEAEGELLSEWHSVRMDTPDVLEPDEPGDGDYAGTVVEALPWEDHVEPEVVDAPAEEVAAEAQAAPADDDDTAQSGPSLEDSAAEEIGLAAAQEAVRDAVIEGISEQQEAEDDGEPYEAVLDEEMLRDLVGEIVRQELMGPLGERITRNVRKLVRREINRALSARNLSGDY